MYASPEAGQALARADRHGELGAGQEDEVPPEEEQSLAAFEDFQGAAAHGALRRRRGRGRVRGRRCPTRRCSRCRRPRAPRSTSSSTLPADTAVAYGAALPEGWAQALLDSLPSYGIPQEQIDQGLSQAEAQTGLSLPEDVETLLGEQLALAVGGDFDVEALVNSGDPSGLPVGDQGPG